MGANHYPEPAAETSLFYGLVYDYPIGTRLRLGAELYGTTAAPASGVTRDLAWGLGATYTVSARATLLLQAGRSVRGASDLNVYAGFLTRLNR